MNMASSFTTSPYNSPHAWSVRAKGTGRVYASKSGGLTFIQASKGCKTCSGKGAIECPGCKGSGRNKKNGNIFERWKCFDCQGFGMKSCPNCGKGGLTPEQRGER
ncbi:protein EMBRYO SAC DEVELOPMENT ARREST 3, chloroplastic isoform X1 [Iris pallida]|uniref:Protein EMBRYO SAC DEVELOPMENT ARREST 3, chloroplastic isoform X1 n=1 Tax=Iris pallida TaxID=29817 RepID=A0AAX6E098_IRIPA|nr:protein EMBRYO SAC DEVELOPMENT ARREST 3, chloroplastic isoform X1 [Iris pallida]